MQVRRLFLAAGAALVPWIAVLGATLPTTYAAQHWQLAWMGFDAFEALGLLATAWLMRRGDPRAGFAAIFTATLLVVDAWFDVTTAGAGDLPTSALLAVGLELPLAAFCAVAAWRLLPSVVPARVLVHA